MIYSYTLRARLVKFLEPLILISSTSVCIHDCVGEGRDNA